MNAQVQEHEIEEITLASSGVVTEKYARVLTAAHAYGVLGDVAKVVAIMLVGGIVTPPASHKYPNRGDWRKLVPQEKESDILGQLAVWSIAEGMPAEEMFENGINKRNFARAQVLYGKICDVLIGVYNDCTTTDGNRENIIKSVCAGGVLCLYERRTRYQGDYYEDRDLRERDLSNASCVSGDAQWIIGLPRDFTVPEGDKKISFRIIEMASAVEPLWVAEATPNAVSLKEVGLEPFYDQQKDCVRSTTKIHFGKLVYKMVVDDPAHPDAAEQFALWLAKQKRLSVSHDTSPRVCMLAQIVATNALVQERAEMLNMRAGKDLFKVYTETELKERYKMALFGARSLAEVVFPEPLRLMPPDKRMAEEILRNNPDTIVVLGKEFAVMYTRNDEGFYMDPMIVLDSKTSERWRELPDDGIFLPSGRAVCVKTRFFGLSCCEANIRDLKDCIVGAFICKARQEWRRRRVPAPTFDMDNDKNIPFVKDMFYRDVNGEEHFMYGTVVWDEYEYRFEGRWYDYEEYAQSAYEKSVEKLKLLRAQNRATNAIRERLLVAADDYHHKHTCIMLADAFMSAYDDCEVVINAIEKALAEVVSRKRYGVFDENLPRPAVRDGYRIDNPFDTTYTARFSTDNTSTPQCVLRCLKIMMGGK